MTAHHVPEVPANVTGRASGPATITVTWDASWYAGFTPLKGHDVVVTDSSDAATIHQVEGGHPWLQVTHLVDGENYRFMVAGRNEAGSSAFAFSSDLVVMTFSMSEIARHGTYEMSFRFAAFRRNSLTKRVPTGAAAQQMRDEYRDAPQQPDDRYAALRSFRRDEATTWVPPTSKS